MAIRTFLALDLDAPIRRAIAAAAAGLPADGAKVRWVEPQNLHLTMKFLGDVPDEDVLNVCRAVEAVAGGLAPPAFDVVGLECTPNRGPVKMVWANVRDPGRKLADAFKELEAAMEALGFDVERRAFRPHITVGRVRYCPNPAAMRQAAARLADEEFGTQDAGEIVVYSSQLAREGPVYAAMAHCRFGR
jgi:2'-5' RNA ligase